MPPIICKRHKEKMKLFCKRCKRTVCMVCCNECHKNCQDFLTIQDMMAEAKGQLMARKEEFDVMIKRNKAVIETFAGRLYRFLEKSASVKIGITETVQETIDRLEILDIQIDPETMKLMSKIKLKQMETNIYQQQSQFIQQALELEDEGQLFEMYVSSVSGAVAEPLESQEVSRDESDLDFKQKLRELMEEIEKIDIKSSNDILDLTATPILHEVLNAKFHDGCDVRDAVVMSLSDVKVTLFADFGSKRVTSFYKKKTQVCSSVLKVPGKPWSITVISEGTVAVSVPYSQSIIIVAVTPDLELLTTIQTSKKYKGLSALDESTLVVCSDDIVAIDLIDMQGNILRSFTTLPGIVESIVNPHYIHVTNQDTILVSDWSRRSVTCFTQSGDLIFHYASTGDNLLEHPSGITSTSKGDILVSDWFTHRVIRLSASGEYISDVLTAEDCVKYPFGLCIDEDKLCVTLAEKGLHKYTFTFKNVE